MATDAGRRSAGCRASPGTSTAPESVRAVTEECVELGVEFLTVYAFSTENWRGPPEEVSALLQPARAFHRAGNADADEEQRAPRRPSAALTSCPRAARRRCAKPSSSPRRIPPPRSSSRSTTAAAPRSWTPSAPSAAEAAAGRLTPAEDRLSRRFLPATLYTATIPIPICSSAPPAKCGSPTSCSGNSATPKST